MTKLLTFSDLALLLHTNANALKTRHCRNPDSIPPVVRIPGDRRFFFCAEEVERWMTSFIQTAAHPPKKRGPGRPRKSGGRYER